MARARCAGTRRRALRSRAPCTIWSASGWGCRSGGSGDSIRPAHRGPPSPSASTRRRRSGPRSLEAEQYPILKIKLGTDRDIEILRTIRDATDKEIRVDANCGWTVKRTMQMLPVLKEFGVTVLEQPLPPDELDGLAEVDPACRDPGDRGRELRDGGRHPAAWSARWTGSTSSWPSAAVCARRSG